MSARISLIAALLLSVGAARLWAGISVSPAFVEVTLDKGRPAGRFEIANLGDVAERYRVKALHFRFSKDGGLLRLESDDRSLAPWIKFNPAELTVEPKTSRVVRFVIVPRGSLVPGEYWAAMELENLNTQVGKSKDTAGREIKVEVVTTVIVPIFGTVGAVEYQGTFEELKAAPDPQKGTVIETLVSNKGSGRLLAKGEYEVQDASGKALDKGELGYAYILPNSDRAFSDHVRTTLPPGDYTIRVRYTAPQLKDPLTRETKLTLTAPSVPPPEKQPRESADGRPTPAAPPSP